LARAFPDIPPEYGLSRELQTRLQEHLAAIHGGRANALVNIDEVVIPEPEFWLARVTFELLPADQQTHLAQTGR
jgi:hypothetical protein